ncbi:MAG: beta strand repeat-containing protein, partial [Phycisphaerae bacterium]
MRNNIFVRKTVLSSCAAVCLAAAPLVSSASTVYTANWTGGTGDWSNSANWLYSPAAPSPATFPDDGNDGLDYAVQINAAGPTILDVSASVFALRIGTNGTLTTASGGSPVLNVGPDSFENYGKIDIVDNSSLTTGGTINNNGVIDIGSGGTGGASTLMANGNTTLSGNGSVILSGGDSSIDGNGYALTVANTISGTGTLKGFSTLTNNGTIDANVAGGQLTISGGAVANNQLLEASNGGTLALTNTTVSGTGPVALNGTGDKLILSGTTLDNVHLYTNSGSVITVAAGAASLINDAGGGNIDLNGTLNIADAATLNVEGYMGGGGGSGVINVGDGNSPATLALVGTTNLGVNTLLNGQSVIQGNGNALTVGSTISGTGTLTGFSTLTNNLTINADVTGGQLTISGGAVANNQLLEASNGGTLALTNTTVSGTGPVALNGTGDKLILSGTTLDNVHLYTNSG